MNKIMMFRRKICIVSLLFAIAIFINPNIVSSAEKHEFVIARLKYSGGGDWYNGPTEIPNWLKALRERTDIDAANDQVVITLTDKDLFSYPFIFMTGHGNIRFNDKEIKALRNYLIHGGFLYADDDYGMDKSFRREMRRVFPKKSWVEVPFEHLIYHCFYNFPKGLPKIHEHYPGPPHGYALFHEGRMIAFYTYNTNITDGLDNPDVHNDKPNVREQALRMAINIAVYALTH